MNTGDFIKDFAFYEDSANNDWGIMRFSNNTIVIYYIDDNDLL